MLTSFGQSPSVKIRNIERAPGENYTIVTDSNGVQTYQLLNNSGIDANLTPINYIPSATGNTQNLNQIVVDPAGDTWAIDQNGDAIKIDSEQIQIDSSIYATQFRLDTLTESIYDSLNNDIEFIPIQDTVMISGFTPNLWQPLHYNGVGLEPADTTKFASFVITEIIDNNNVVISHEGTFQTLLPSGTYFTPATAGASNMVAFETRKQYIFEVYEGYLYLDIGDIVLTGGATQEPISVDLSGIRDSLVNHEGRINALEATPDLVDDADSDPTNEIQDLSGIRDSVQTNLDSVLLFSTRIESLENNPVGQDLSGIRDSILYNRDSVGNYAVRILDLENQEQTTVSSVDNTISINQSTSNYDLSVDNISTSDSLWLGYMRDSSLLTIQGVLDTTIVDSIPLFCNTKLASTNPEITQKFSIWIQGDQNVRMFQDDARSVAVNNGDDVVVAESFAANGIDLVQGNSTANHPQFVSAQQNGLGLIRFEETDDYLEADLGEFGGVAGTPFSMKIVFQVIGGGSNATILAVGPANQGTGIGADFGSSLDPDLISSWQLGRGNSNPTTVGEFEGANIFEDMVFRYTDSNEASFFYEIGEWDDFIDGMPHEIEMNYDGTDLDILVDGVNQIPTITPTIGLHSGFYRFFGNRTGLRTSAGDLLEFEFSSPNLNSEELNVINEYHACKWAFAPALSANLTLASDCYDTKTQYSLIREADGDVYYTDSLNNVYSSPPANGLSSCSGGSTSSSTSSNSYMIEYIGEDTNGNEMVALIDGTSPVDTAYLPSIGVSSFSDIAAGEDAGFYFFDDGVGLTSIIGYKLLLSGSILSLADYDGNVSSSVTLNLGEGSATNLIPEEFTADGTQTAFILSNSIPVGAEVEVYDDGSRLNNAFISSASGTTVTLTYAPTVNSLIIIDVD